MKTETIETRGVQPLLNVLQVGTGEGEVTMEVTREVTDHISRLWEVGHCWREKPGTQEGKSLNGSRWCGGSDSWDTVWTIC